MRAISTETCFCFATELRCKLWEKMPRERETSPIERYIFSVKKKDYSQLQRKEVEPNKSSLSPAFFVGGGYHLTNLPKFKINSNT